MEPHIHSGFVVFLTVGVYAVVFFQMVRFIAAWLSSHEMTSRVGDAMGALVHFA